MSISPAICWFRLDLRLDDHPALHAAAEHGGPVIPVFIWAPDEEGNWPPGAASRWWLHHSLAALNTQLQRCHSRLIIRRGPTLRALESLIKETGATHVFWNRRYEPTLHRRDTAVQNQLRQRGIVAEDFHDNPFYNPADISNSSGRPFQVFTPFWKACLQRTEPPPPLPAPRQLLAPSAWPESLALEELQLLPRIDWATGMRAAWQPGSAGAQVRLDRFCKAALRNYVSGREQPDHNGTSRLSPHLHFGEISPRRVWHSIKQATGGKAGGPIPLAAEPYLRQLGWREFAFYLLHHFPHTVEQPLREEFAKFPWDGDAQLLRRWQRGQTGYPLVDAGMRQLWSTGWMHNRVRMVAGSFLVKDLLHSWIDGARWFWDTLVDADMANNTLGWQWVAGCGADAAPYFRVFNPSLQGEKFDPQGKYVRHWVPELARLPDEWIHQPWQAPAEVLAAAQVVLGKNYPSPMVEHKAARAKALQAFQSIKS